MRQLINGITFTPGTWVLTVPFHWNFGVEHIRLIVNETQKVVICSSMQKDNIVSVVGQNITYSSSLPALAAGDQLTVEIDLGTDFNWLYNDFLISAKAAGPLGEPFDVEGEMAERVALLFNKPNVGFVHPSAAQCLFANTAIRHCVIAAQAMKNNDMNGMFRNCQQLESLSFPNLESAETYCFYDGPFSNNCPLHTIEGTAKVWQIGSGDSGLTYWTGQLPITHIRVLTPADGDLHFEKDANLDFNSVKSILTSANNSNMNDKTVAFYDNVLTIDDDENGTLEALRTAVVAQGCNVANLTINEYSNA